MSSDDGYQCPSAPSSESTAPTTSARAVHRMPARLPSRYQSVTKPATTALTPASVTKLTRWEPQRDREWL